MPQDNEIEKKIEFWQSILTAEGLADWKILHPGSPALCRAEAKEILIDKDQGTPMFLHEVAHALTYQHNEAMGDKTGHHSIFADKFTELVNKYMFSSTQVINQNLYSFKAGEEAGYKKAMKDVEAWLCENVLYIGNEIPEAVAKDTRPKFVELQYPGALFSHLKKQFLQGGEG